MATTTPAIETSGPTIGRPTTRSLQLFDMCSYDVDSFRDFIQSSGFQDVFELDETTMESLRSDDDKLLRFAFRFLKQVLFGEQSIPIKAGARDRRLATARERLAQRHKEAAAEKETEMDERYQSER